MNVATIEMPIEEAKRAYREYREAVRANPNAEDKACMLGYQALSKGKAIIDVARVILDAGLNDQWMPKLALARASWTSVVFRSRPRNIEYGQPLHTGGIILPVRDFPEHGKRWQLEGTAQAMVPFIPPAIRPANLSRYFILWEAIWKQIPPIDPILLKRLTGSLYVILATWNLTELERGITSQRQRG